MRTLMEGSPRIAQLLLRIGLGAVTLWFGLSEILQPDMWTAWVPAWTAVFGLTPTSVVYLNGAFETIAGMLLLLGLLVRPIALALFFHMLLIVFDIGLTAIGVRDLGLAAALAALALMPARNAEQSYPTL